MERLHHRLRFQIAFGKVRQHANSPHALGLLRARRQRPRRRAANERDELAALHSITSSAAERPGPEQGPPARVPWLWSWCPVASSPPYVISLGCRFRKALCSFLIPPYLTGRYQTAAGGD